MDPDRSRLGIQIRPGRRLILRFRSLVMAFTLGIALLPLSLLSMVGLLFSGVGRNASSLTYGFQVMRIVRNAVQFSEDGRLSPASDYNVPDWLNLIVMDTGGTVVLSTFPDIKVGDQVNGVGNTEFNKSLFSGYRFLADTLTIKGRVAGAYAARLSSDGFGLWGDPAFHFNPAPFLLLLAILAFAAGGFFSAGLVRSFRSLERAAGRIASGDLESPISVQGPREISALAGAMESMRNSLRENISRRARFLAGVSHDLRTPLTSIKGFLEAMEDGLAEDPRTFSRYLCIMTEKTRILEDRITELLDFARMETGEWRLRLVSVPLASLLEHFASVYTKDALARSVVLRSAFLGIGNVAVSADEKMLSRAFENIITNALRYIPAGGEVILSAEPDGDSVVIDITDNGPGIPATDLPHIFEPWFRGKNSHGDQNGLGLGLSIARSIISDHGWTLSAVSEPGKGTRFRIRIPPAHSS